MHHERELSICQSLLCHNLGSFRVLSQIKPQAPLHVVPIRPCLQLSALRPYSSQNPKTLMSHKLLKESTSERHQSLVGMVCGKDDDGF